MKIQKKLFITKLKEIQLKAVAIQKFKNPLTILVWSLWKRKKEGRIVINSIKIKDILQI